MSTFFFVMTEATTSDERGGLITDGNSTFQDLAADILPGIGLVGLRMPKNSKTSSKPVNGRSRSRDGHGKRRKS